MHSISSGFWINHQKFMLTNNGRNQLHPFIQELSFIINIFLLIYTQVKCAVMGISMDI